jgi:FAD/FMN-containing dehydrogenase
LEYTPEDMVVTVEAGIPLAQLQQRLSNHRQWLPIDPPSQDISIHDLLALNLSGPRRFGYGTIREHLLGLRVVLADGRTIKSGGKVVKNVAGYDLARLFIGARDSLGIIVEATFKLRPLPAAEAIMALDVKMADLEGMLRSVIESDLVPVILDVHRGAAGLDGATVIVGLAGTQGEVDWQLGLARALGFGRPATLDYEHDFWKAGHGPHRVSVRPSRVPETLTLLGSRPFVARAGNGVIYFRGEPIASKHAPMPGELMRRVKATYDPKQILPEFTL